jgi:hypothetical protein
LTSAVISRGTGTSSGSRRVWINIAMKARLRAAPAEP